MDIDPSLIAQCRELEEQARRDGIDLLYTGAAVVRDGKILIVVRSDTEEALAGYTELPGGGVEEGERILEGLARELLEETGLTLHLVREYTGSFEFIKADGKRARQFNFLVETDGGDIVLNPAEHISFFWYDPRQPSYFSTISPAMREAIVSSASFLC